MICHYSFGRRRVHLFINWIGTHKEYTKVCLSGKKKLYDEIELSKGTVSKILNYHKGFSKETIRKLSHHFKLSQEAFNRPYPLINQVPKNLKKAS